MCLLSEATSAGETRGNTTTTNKTCTPWAFGPSTCPPFMLPLKSCPKIRGVDANNWTESHPRFWEVGMFGHKSLGIWHIYVGSNSGRSMKKEFLCNQKLVTILISKGVWTRKTTQCKIWQRWFHTYQYCISLCCVHITETDLTRIMLDSCKIININKLSWSQEKGQQGSKA